MSRSNGSPSHAGGWPPQQTHWPQPQPGEAGAYQADPGAEPIYHEPQAHHHGARAGAQASQLDPYASHGGAGHPAYAEGYDHGYAPPHASAHGYEPQAPGLAPPQPDLHGSMYGQAPQAAQAHDPRYDLARYGARAGAGWRGGEPSLDWEQRGNGYAGAPPIDTAGYPDPRTTLIGYEEEGTQAGALEPAFDLDEAGEYEAEEEPPRRSRMVLIAGALAGAIAMGGGLAFAYKSLLAPARTQIATPVVKGDSGPSKVKPADPGGKQFAHADSKILGRLGDAGAAASAATASGDSDTGGTRRVQTLTIGRDGSIAPPAAPGEPPTPSASSQDPVSVPGLTIVDGLGGRPSVMPARETPAAPPSPPPTPQKPVVIAKATPVTAPEPPARTAAISSEPPPAPAKKAPAKAAPSGGGGAGFVAVLASVPASSKSRMDALKQFADLQQKYGSLLQNKTPDVQEANLGEKGTYHRLLVGPPGSREQASTLCNGLKAAGYASCWVTSY